MTRVALIAALVLLAAAAPAQAAPDCRETRQPRTLLSDQGTLESVAVDPRGRLLFSTPTSLQALDRPGGAPRKFADVPEPGGIVFDDAGNVIVGTGNSIENGSTGDAVGRSGLLRVDLASGMTSPFATGLSMANGVVRGRDGFIYATNDFGSNVDRIKPGGGPAEQGWAKVQSANGVAIDATGRWLYVAQTFRPAAIAQVDLRDPSKVVPYVTAGPEDTAAGLDGMAIDAAGRLFVVGNGSGELWRVSGSPPSICIVARGLPKFPDGPSAVAVGRAGTPFAPENLYVVTFDGHVYEFSGVAVAARGSGGSGPGGVMGGGGAQPAPAPGPAAREPRTGQASPVRLRVLRTRAVVGRRTRLVVFVESFSGGAWRGVRGARVRVGRRSVRTGPGGRARFHYRFGRRGRVALRTPGARAVSIRVVRRP